MPHLRLPTPLVTVDWLYQQKDHRDLVILDASWFMPDAQRDGKSEWFETRIPGALYFDFDGEICDRTSDLPHMMPSESDFQNSVQRLGINQDSLIVVYDTIGILTSPRVWWMLNSMGAENVAVLDGGLPAWQEKGLPVERGEPINHVNKGDFIACYQDLLFCHFEDVLLATQDTQRVIIDARSSGRFFAQEPEPREDVRSGHMPNAKNLPFADILVDHKILDAYQLAVIFEAIAPKDKGLIFSCGSGVTACILALGATLAGYEKISVYDGSWTEWGGLSSLPVVS